MSLDESAGKTGSSSVVPPAVEVVTVIAYIIGSSFLI